MSLMSGTIPILSGDFVWSAICRSAIVYFSSPVFLSLMTSCIEPFPWVVSQRR